MESLDLSGSFGGAYAGRRVLVTGHTGFKGSWLALWLQALGAEVGGLALDPDTSPAHWNLLALRISDDRRADLRDPVAVRNAVCAFQPEIVFHLAAQPLVRRSYREPVATFASNVTGLVHLLEAVRQCPSVAAVVNATTDKVYEAMPTTGGYREDSRLGGHDPYSTSKACAELVSACYRRSYFTSNDGGRSLQLATARAGNVIGGGDWAEDRLVPDLVRAASSGHALRLRNPNAIRPWQHVLEPLSGYLRIGQLLLTGTVRGDAWNLGPARDAMLTVGEVVGQLHHEWPQLSVEHDSGAHPHEAAELVLDCGKALRDLQWRATWTAATTFRRTAAWYRDYLERGQINSREDLTTYVMDASNARQTWAVA